MKDCKKDECTYPNCQCISDIDDGDDKNYYFYHLELTYFDGSRYYSGRVGIDKSIKKEKVYSIFIERITKRISQHVNKNIPEKYFIIKSFNLI